MGFRGLGQGLRAKDGAVAEVRGSQRCGMADAGLRACPRLIALVVLLLPLGMAAAVPAAGGNKEKLTYGEGLIVNLPLPVSEVGPVVEEVAGNGLIRGTKEYNKDEYVAGAKAAVSSSVFPAWTEGGKVFYKVRLQAIDPRNFKDSSDVGTLVVRYVVQPQGEKNTVLRIDALFEEDFRHIVHASDGSVEGAEFKDIREHLDAIEVMKSQNVEAERERQERLAKKKALAARNEEATAVAQPWPPPPEPQAAERSDEGGQRVVLPEAAETASPVQAPPTQTLEERVKDLRKQVERLVKAPGA